MTILHVRTILFSLSLLFSNHAFAQQANVFNGYIEAEYTYLAPSGSGWLKQLKVQAGDLVQEEQLLFSLDDDSQQINVTQAQAKLHQAQANLADLQTGARPDEIKSLQAQLTEAQATLNLAASEKERWTRLAEHGNASLSQKDQAVQAWQVAKAKINTLNAELHLAKLGARDYQIRSAQAAVEAAQSALAQAKWQLSQRTIKSPINGRVEQVFHRQGELIPANTPVLSIITPQQLKVKFYVPQNRLSQMQVGNRVQVKWDGQQNTLPAKISFISNVAEFTPPIIFSQESRQKLVYLIEAKLQQQQLRAGQPVDVILPEPASHD